MDFQAESTATARLVHRTKVRVSCGSARRTVLLRSPHRIRTIEQPSLRARRSQSNNRVYELGEANRTTEFTSSAKPIEIRTKKTAE
jgi:hypothetical protein